MLVTPVLPAFLLNRFTALACRIQLGSAAGPLHCSCMSHHERSYCKRSAASGILSASLGDMPDACPGDMHCHRTFQSVTLGKFSGAVRGLYATELHHTASLMVATLLPLCGPGPNALRMCVQAPMHTRSLADLKMQMVKTELCKSKRHLQVAQALACHFASVLSITPADLSLKNFI